MGALAALITFAYGSAMVIVGLTSDPDDSPRFIMAGIGAASILMAFVFGTLAWFAASSSGAGSATVTAMLGGAAAMAAVLLVPVIGMAAYVVAGGLGVVTAGAVVGTLRGGRGA